MNISKPEVSPLSNGKGPAQPQPVKAGQSNMEDAEATREDLRQSAERSEDSVRQLSREEGERIQADRDPDDPVSP